MKTTSREWNGHLSRTLSSYVFQKVHFGSKYLDVLRSPQKLKIAGGPTVVRRDALLIEKGGKDFFL